MAEIILSQAGGVIGRHLLPGGLNLFGHAVSGAAIGQALGSVAGRAIDAALSPPIEGPRLKSLHIMDSREGAALPLVYGRMRVGGQVIWAARFKEYRTEESGGKGGPTYTSYSYSASFAVALCEGPITRVDRIWANGELLTLGDVNWRLYHGSETQLPDPLIEAVQGSDQAPAYRGTAYIVFEDLPLDAFGHRLPQLSFEIVRAGTDSADSLAAHVEGVNVIPASGEFVYASTIVRQRWFPGIEQPLNMNNSSGVADFLVSLDQLQSDLPKVKHAALTVAWFGDDLRAGSCRVRPGVETHDRETVPYAWSVADTGRAGAYLLSQTDGRPNYGGTPADQAVLEGIAALQAAGIEVTLSPFLLMDVPPGNGLPDPYGWGAEQAAFPWRGRIRVSADQTDTARTEIENFVGTDGGFGYRHFILHHARLAAQAGGVDTFLIGSELVGLTRARDAAGRFPFAEALVQLAGEAKAILGEGVAVSYAADWTEYGAYSPPGGSGDVLFPLDQIWASENVDFVGVDWYPPTSDWRDGDTHLDALAGAPSIEDADYLKQHMAGGENYDWYYASQADRDAQIRTPIIDTWLGEDWLYRQKDLRGWWSNAHHERKSGTRPDTPTDWQPGSKPVRLIEIGFPAVDKGTNSPNLFFDPKSAESALPPYSNGARDDLLQRRAIAAAHVFWGAEAMVEQILVWAWDARPWPDFPARDETWSDGDNWQFGHWLNGRSGLIGLGETVEDLADKIGIEIDASALDGALDGFAIENVMPLATALSSLATGYDFGLREDETGMLAVHPDSATAIAIDSSKTIQDSYRKTRTLLDKQPNAIALHYVSADHSYQPSVTEARRETSGPALKLNVQLPLVLGDGQAEAIADQLLERTVAREQISIAIAPGAASCIEVLDTVSLDDVAWQVTRIESDGLRTQFTLQADHTALPRIQSVSPPTVDDPATVSAAPYGVMIDGPILPHLGGTGLFVAASGSPWSGPISVKLGPSETALIETASVPNAAGIGTVVADLAIGPYGTWDEVTQLDVEMPNESLVSVEDALVLAGVNRVLVQHDEGWELIAFANAELIGAQTYRLSRLLRGLSGSPIRGVPAGQTVILADARLIPISIGVQNLGRDMFWQIAGGDVESFTYLDRAGLPARVGALSAVVQGEEVEISWIPQSVDLVETAVAAMQAASFQVEAYLGATRVLATTQTETVLMLAGDLADSVRVAAIGEDGRMGEWASIPLPPD